MTRKKKQKKLLFLCTTLLQQSPILEPFCLYQKKGLSHIAYFGNKLSGDELPSEGQFWIKNKILCHCLEVKQQNYGLASIRAKGKYRPIHT